MVHVYVRTDAGMPDTSREQLLIITKPDQQPVWQQKLARRLLGLMVHVSVRTYHVPWYHGTYVRTHVAYMLADIVVAIPAGDLAVEAVV